MGNIFIGSSARFCILACRSSTDKKKKTRRIFKKVGGEGRARAKEIEDIEKEEVVFADKP